MIDLVEHIEKRNILLRYKQSQAFFSMDGMKCCLFRVIDVGDFYCHVDVFTEEGEHVSELDFPIREVRAFQLRKRETDVAQLERIYARDTGTKTQTKNI